MEDEWDEVYRYVMANTVPVFRDPDAYTRQMIDAACASPARTSPRDEGDWDTVTNVRLAEIDAVFTAHARPPAVHTVSVVSQGKGYTTPPVVITGGTGTGATFTVTNAGQVVRSPPLKPLTEDDRALHRALSRSKGTFSRESQCGWVADD